MQDSRDIGATVPGWSPPPRPVRASFVGRYARLEPLSAETHADALFRAFAVSDRIWDFLPYGPFAAPADYAAWIHRAAPGDDPLFFAVENLDSGRLEGVASYLRIAPDAGSIEVGHINFSPALQRTRAASEAMFLMMQWAFGAGYRRYEWKCNALNLSSRRAAQRLGLSFEGVFRQAAVVKGRNRDTAWFAAIDAEWHALEAAFTTWLDPANFTSDGRQRLRLADLTRPLLVAEDPALTR